jgi:ketosteroid isomerase-like protein
MNETMIRQFFSAFNAGDIETMRSMMTEKTVLYFPKTEPLAGAERICKFLMILLKRIPKLNFSIHRVIIQDHRAAVHWTNEGVSRKNDPYENEGMTLFEEENGKFVFISDFFKDTEKF